MAGSEIWTETRFYSRSRHFRIGQNRSDPAGTDCNWCFESDELRVRDACPVVDWLTLGAKSVFSVNTISQLPQYRNTANSNCLGPQTKLLPVVYLLEGVPGRVSSCVWSRDNRISDITSQKPCQSKAAVHNEIRPFLRSEGLKTRDPCFWTDLAWFSSLWCL